MNLTNQDAKNARIRAQLARCTYRVHAPDIVTVQSQLVPGSTLYHPLFFCVLHAYITQFMVCPRVVHIFDPVFLTSVTLFS